MSCPSSTPNYARGANSSRPSHASQAAASEPQASDAPGVSSRLAGWLRRFWGRSAAEPCPYPGTEALLPAEQALEALEGLVCEGLVRAPGAPACAGVAPKHIVSDINYLHKLWHEVKARSEKAAAPHLIHEEVGLLIGMVRDVMTEDVGRILIDSDREYKKLQRYLRTFSPNLTSRVKLYREKTPIFDKFNIEREIEKTLERKIWLKKGGYIVIDPTEALVAIDINTGRYVGKKDQEETIFETNMLAAREIPRQLRLRDIGGIIVIDFIDMEKEANRRKVLAELRQNLRKDRSRAKAFAVSELGLVEVSRKRVRPSLLHFFSDECPYCKGSGRVLSFDSLANKIEQWIRRVGSRTKEKRIQLRVNSSLALYMEEERRQILDAMERQYKLKIEIQDDPRLHREDFKLVSLSSFRDLMQEVT